jgi:hypothetical protein
MKIRPYDAKEFFQYLTEYRSASDMKVQFDDKGKGNLQSKDRSNMSLYAPGELN